MLRLYNARPPEPRINRKWTAGILSAHALAVLTLVGLAMINPKIWVWISDAAQAELAASAPPAVVPKMRLAERASPMRLTQILSRLYR